MTADWTHDELAAVAEAEEPEIAPAEVDGSLRRATPIWVIVRVGDDVYVRSYRGHQGRWFRAAQRSNEGAINAGGVRKRVRLVETEDPARKPQATRPTGSSTADTEPATSIR